MFHFHAPCLCQLKLFEIVPCLFTKWPPCAAGRSTVAFSLAHCVPAPDDTPDRDWCLQNWGTGQDVITDLAAVDGMRAEFAFEADGSVPFKAFDSLADRYPTLRIGLLADEVRANTATMTTWADGKRIGQIANKSPTASAEEFRRSGRSSELKRHARLSKELYAAYYSTFPEWSPRRR